MAGRGLITTIQEYPLWLAQDLPQHTVMILATYG
jgi:hypothetical protein